LLLRVINGELKIGSKVRISEIGEDIHSVVEVGTFTPNMEKLDVLKEGMVGYINCQIKDPEFSAKAVG